MLSQQPYNCRNLFWTKWILGLSSTSSSSEDESHSECEEPSQPNKRCGSITTKGKQSIAVPENIGKNLTGLTICKDREGAFCKICKQFSSLPENWRCMPS